MKINDILDIFNELETQAGKEACFVCSSFYERHWGEALKVNSTIHNCIGNYSKQVISVCNTYKCPLGKESTFVEMNELKAFKLFIKEKMKYD